MHHLGSPARVGLEHERPDTPVSLHTPESPLESVFAPDRPLLSASGITGLFHSVSCRPGGLAHLAFRSFCSRPGTRAEGGRSRAGGWGALKSILLSPPPERSANLTAHFPTFVGGQLDRKCPSTRLAAVDCQRRKGHEPATLLPAALATSSAKHRLFAHYLHFVVNGKRSTRLSSCG